MFKIGDFSKMAQVSVKTLRYYAEMGLLAPAWVDRYTSYRYYTVEQLPRLNRILALKELGFSLEQIKMLLREDLSGTELRNMVRLKKTEIENQIAEEQARLRRIEARIQQIDLEGTLPTYEIIIRHVARLRVAGIRQEIPSQEHLPALFSELTHQLALMGGKIAPAGHGMAIYYDSEFQDNGLDVEAAIPVTNLARSSERLSFHELPSVEMMACTVCQGNMIKAAETYRTVLTWVDANGYQILRPMREIYLHTGQLPIYSEDLVVEMQYPIQRKSIPTWITEEKEKKNMEPKIVSLPTFTVVGMMYYGKNQNNEISQLWSSFNPHIAEIKYIRDGAFGLCQPPDETGAFRYLAGMSVARTDEIPVGMEIWSVPAQTYAVFSCALPSIGQTYQYVFETWIPRSQYQYIPGIDFEYYDESFDPADANSLLKIYIPIKEKKVEEKAAG